MACGAQRMPCLPGLVAELWWPLTAALQGEFVHPLPALVEELDPSGVGAGRGGQLGCNLLAPRLGLFQILFSKARAPAQCCREDMGLVSKPMYRQTVTMPSYI